jgi:release factor glutamine methyltransferase
VSRELHASGTNAETTVGALLNEMAAALAAAGVSDAAREARDMIAALRDAPRFWPTVNAHVAVSVEERRAARDAAAKRAAGAPFAYAVGTAAFRKLTLAVDERVLIPRPETELIVDLVLQLTDAWPGGTAIDVGTGSGAIALALATEGTFDRVLAGDISSDALEVARENSARVPEAARARLEFRAGSLLRPFESEQARIVVSNPPYLAGLDAASLPASVRSWEPAVALHGGPDGMAAYRALARDARAVLEPNGWLVMEVDSRRASWVVETLSLYDSYADIGVRLDLAGRERFVIARMGDREKQ